MSKWITGCIVYQVLCCKDDDAECNEFYVQVYETIEAAQERITELVEDYDAEANSLYIAEQKLTHIKRITKEVK